MNKKRLADAFLIVAVLFCIILLAGCNSLITQVAATPTQTSLPATATPSLPMSAPTETLLPTLTETPLPTLIYLITATPDPKKTPLVHIQTPTITAPPERSQPLKLPGGLSIEEYPMNGEGVYTTMETLVEARHPERERGGRYWWPKGGTINGKLFEAREDTDAHYFVKIVAILGGVKVFEVDCGYSQVLPSLITAWVYQNQWIIYSYCNDNFDLYWDGVSLNSEKGYESSFAFQLLDQEPFYLFIRDDKVGMFYEDSEVMLGYDEVKLTYCCMTYPPPQHYENMTTFYATIGDQLYYVAIGLFDS